jgi:DMSO/TMAO reductase YedYZ molybdopterin-dependent catalytic subunit
MLAAVNLAGMTAVAQAQTTDQPSRQADATVRRLLARERSSIPDAAHPRLLLDEDRSTLLNLPDRAPAQPTSPTRPAAEPSRSAGWLTPTLGALAAVLALVAVLAARRAHRSQRADQTA